MLQALIVEDSREKPTCFSYGRDEAHVRLHGNQECKGNAKWVVQARKTVCKNFTGKCPKEKFSQKSNSGEIPGLHSIPNPNPPLPAAGRCCLTPLMSLLAEKAQKQLNEIKTCNHCVRLSPRPTLFQEVGDVLPRDLYGAQGRHQESVPAWMNSCTPLSSFPISDLEPGRTTS